jgi:serine/threonine protein kinase
MSLAPGTRLGPYEVVGAIGSGGMGEVYRARDSKLDRFVAIKVLPELFVADPDRVARFEREAKALAALNHPNILAIHDFGISGGTTYAAMELLDGQTLRDRLAAGPLPPRKAADCAAQIARGLAAAHDRGIVHRDLKPENISVSADGDRDGRRTALWTGQDSVRGIAWRPDGREVWYTANHGTDSQIRAVGLSGQQRIVHTTITRTTLFDIAPDGRALLGDENHLRHVEAVTPQHASEARDYALSREQSIAKTISRDGQSIGITDQTFRGYTTYLRRTDGSAPVRVGSGDAQQLSPDGRFIMSVTSAPPMRLMLHPIGPGNSRELSNPSEIVIENSRWLPDNERVVLFGPTARDRSRGYVQRVAGARRWHSRQKGCRRQRGGRWPCHRTAPR